MRKRILPLMLICIITLSGCKKENEPEEISVDDLITLIEKAYANSTSYRDTGRVTANYITDNPFTKIKLFKTVFSNDGRFRFEYRELGNNDNIYIIHRDINQVVKSWWGVTDELETEDDLISPLASATGVSDGTAFHIPSFLLPDEFDSHNTFKTLSDIAILEDETIDGTLCYVLGGYNISDDLVKIYVQKDNYMIRRYTDSHEYDTFDFNRVINIYPERNASISDSEFLFNAP